LAPLATGCPALSGVLKAKSKFVLPAIVLLCLKMKGLRKASGFAGLFVIVIGFVIFAIAMVRLHEPYGAAIGIFFILLGFHFLTNLRIAKLEEEVKAIKEKK
jgi:hypothetical protein